MKSKKSCTIKTTKAFNGKTYKKSGSPMSKAEAKKKAAAHRKRGKNKAARVVDNPCGSGSLLYKRG